MVEVVGDVQSACGAMLLIGIDWSPARQAGELAEIDGLRGHDAVHPATALAAAAPDLVLVTWGRDLARATVQSGVAVAPS